MIFAQQGSVWFDIDAFAKTGLVDHGFSTRLGGTSLHPYGKLNLGLYTDDKKEYVRKNRIDFLHSFGYAPTQVFSTHQVHGVHVCVGEKGDAETYLTKEAEREDADAAITNVPGCVLFTTFADCMPILFLDPVHKAIGVAHAGWRGTLANIAEKTVQALKKSYGSQEKDILVALGPAIALESFEVGREVIEAASSVFHVKDKVLKRTQDINKAYFNLRRANSILLERAGIERKHIFHCNHDTYAENTLFFSHRRSRTGKTGRMGAMIVLKEK